MTASSAVYPPDTSRPLSVVQENYLLRELRAQRAGVQTWPMLVPAVLEIDSAIDDARIEAALTQLTQRHEILRSAFELPPQGENVQHLVATSTRVVLETREYGQVSAERRIQEAVEVQAELAARPMPLADAPLWHASLLRFDGRPTIVILMFEHLIFDGESRTIFAADFTRELDRRRGATGIPADLPRQYSDWTVWQRQMLAGPDGHELLEFWRTHLSGTVPFPPFPVPPGSPASPAQWAAWRSRISNDDRGRITHVARGSGLTLYMALVAAIIDAWHATSGMEDIVIHSPCANRTDLTSQDVIGWFAHSIPTRFRLESPDRGANFLRMVRSELLSTQAYQDLPLPALTKAFQPDSHGRARRRPRLYVAYEHEGSQTWPLSTGGEVRLMSLPEPEPEFESDLSVLFRDDGQDISISLEFNPREIADEFVADFGAELENSMRRLYPVAAHEEGEK